MPLVTLLGSHSQAGPGEGLSLSGNAPEAEGFCGVRLQDAACVSGLCTA